MILVTRIESIHLLPPLAFFFGQRSATMAIQNRTLSIVMATSTKTTVISTSPPHKGCLQTLTHTSNTFTRPKQRTINNIVSRVWCVCLLQTESIEFI